MAKRKRRKQNLLWLLVRSLLVFSVAAVKYAGIGTWAITTSIGSALQRVAQKLPRKKEADADAAAAALAKGKKQQPKPLKNPMYLPLDVEEKVSGSLEDLEETLTRKSQIILLFGRRGSGKSALGFRLLENIAARSKRPCFVLGVKQQLLPAWIAEVAGLATVKPGGVVLVDEGAIAFASRESMKKKNVDMGKLLATARHNDLSLIFITQSTGMIDKSVLNLADVILAKEGSLLQKQMERAAMKKFLLKADKLIKAYPASERNRCTYVFSDDFEGLCSSSLPGFWSEEVSKSRGGEAS